jgi:hypothetical protein
MTSIQATPDDVESLEKAIEAHFQGGGALALSPDVFCNNWDTAKTVLSALQPILSSIPGVGLFAGPAIGIVIIAGDAAKKVVCS